MSYKLLYFNVKARGEFIRCTMHASNLDFEDKRYSFEEWLTIKPTIPSKQLPAFYLPDGKCMSQTVAICKYIAKENGLHGENNWDCYMIDKIIGIGEDIFMALGAIWHAKEDDEKAKLQKELSETKAPALLTQYSDLLKESTTGFLANTKKASLADIWFYVITDALVGMAPGNFEKYPDLKAHKEKVLAAFPKMAEHIKTRPETTF